MRSGPDTIVAWQNAIGPSAGTTVEEDVGFFSKRSRTTYAGSTAMTESWTTTGGGHTFASSRQDFHPIVRAWEFLSSFRRNAAGGLDRRIPTWITGTY